MKQVFEELIALLNDQKAALSSMLELSREKQLTIVSDDTGKLENIVRQELRQLSKLGALDRKRAGFVKGITEELDMRENDVTVSAITRLVEPNEREAIIKLQTELVDLIEQHSNINAENRELIKARLEYSEAMLELMVDPEDPLNNFYGGDGKADMDKKRTTSFFNGHA
ncbi:MAG: flagellar protein FlgN [Oscillospiraceae bacterium]|nr:flagellar protein FlgN [Oscillospiraceae bacterium]